MARKSHFRRTFDSFLGCFPWYIPSLKQNFNFFRSDEYGEEAEYGEEVEEETKIADEA